MSDRRRELTGFRFFLAVWATCLVTVAAGTYAAVTFWGASVGGGGFVGRIVGLSFFLAACAAGGRQARLRRERDKDAE